MSLGTGCVLHDHLLGGRIKEQSCDDYSNAPMSAIIRSDKKSYWVVIGCFKHHPNCGQEIIFSFENGLVDEIAVYFRCSHKFTVFRNFTNFLQKMIE